MSTRELLARYSHLKLLSDVTDTERHALRWWVLWVFMAQAQLVGYAERCRLEYEKFKELAEAQKNGGA